ncbi:GH24251 [Drosophila grimshawi]|uniref:GH24251 n=2 Tax=Drosophila grimshawi TaxID=7222 RepID=B4JMW9_DROGR|nr:GH24251 [Drosophila grimshawi]
MTLPTNTNAGNNNNNGKNSNGDDESDMFGPPRVSPPIGYHHHRSRVPMISPKLRQREERKRILQLCAHKLERIKDSESNLRRSVCINNTYCRLTDELRREKQMRYLQNLPKTENSSAELARENLFQTNMDDAKPMNNNINNNNNNNSNNNNNNNNGSRTICSIENHQLPRVSNNNNNINNNNNSSAVSSLIAARKRHLSNSNLVNDLEILDRELSAINAPMPLIDPEITQGAEQLEKAALSASRKRMRTNNCNSNSISICNSINSINSIGSISSSEDESDRLVREALSQFYIPPQRLISAIEDCPLDVVVIGAGAGNITGDLMSCSSNSSGGSSGVVVGNSNKRVKLNACTDHLVDHLVDFDMNQNQKDFEVIMDALRLGTPSPSSPNPSDSCGQAAMLSESASVFHNLVVTSLET